MIRAITYSFAITLVSCTSTQNISLPQRNTSAVTGSGFYKHAAAFNWQRRDSFAVKEILEGNIPSFLKKFVPVHTEIKDSAGKIIKATFYVSPDYLSIGNDNDWARIN